MVGSILSRLWTDSCTVSVREKAMDGDGVTAFHEKKIYEGLPCRLSYSGTAREYAEAKLGGAAAGVKQAVKLILPGDALVPPGSRIRIRREDREMDFCASGLPKIFSAHQEIMLENFEKWA